MKTQLDKWDNLIVFYTKGCFDAISPKTSMVDELRAIMAERSWIDYKFIKAADVVSLLLSNIINPFILDGERGDRILCKIIEDSSPENCWRTGYKGGYKFNGQPSDIPYDYNEAMIYNLVSIICCTEVKYFPGLTNADEELFWKCLARIK